MPSPTATFLSHTNSYTEPSPCTCLPAPTPCLKLSFGIPSQKHGSHVGGTPASFRARPLLQLRACWARSQSLPHPPTSADGTPETAAGCRPRGAERRAEPAPGLGGHWLMVSPVAWALACSDGAVREVKWPVPEVRKLWLSGQVSPFTLMRGFFPFWVFFFFPSTPFHIFSPG